LSHTTKWSFEKLSALYKKANQIASDDSKSFLAKVIELKLVLHQPFCYIDEDWDTMYIMCAEYKDFEHGCAFEVIVNFGTKEIVVSLIDCSQ